MYLLEGRIQNYAWGSRTAIADLLGAPSPSSRPEAELWLGAHPSAPSRVLRDGQWRSLLDLIERDPALCLGNEVIARFGPRLPFLLKVLAAETPLSLQAHPDLAQARAGFDEEDAANVPLDATHRKYKDRNHKPELLAALSPFHALVGFRKADETLALLHALGNAELIARAEPIVRSPDRAGLRAFYSALTALDADTRKVVVRVTLDACDEHVRRSGAFMRAARWVIRLGDLYPDDIGITLALTLNYVELSPGEAIFLPAGDLHAYLGGVGVEIMANSDNVLRGGLTPKYVDPSELSRVLTFADGPPDVLSPQGTSTERTYTTPAPEFALSRIDLRRGETFRAERRGGPEIVLCVDGGSRVRSVGGPSMELGRGAAFFVTAAEPAFELSGTGTLFRATVGRSFPVT